MKKLIIMFAVALLLTACGGRTTVGINKANISPRFDASKVNRVAVIGFGQNTGLKYDTTIIADKFTAELVSSEIFSLMDRNDIDKIMKEFGFQQQVATTGLLNEETMERLKALGADSILTGKLISFKQVDRGHNILFAEAHLLAKLLRIETGEVLWSAEMQKRSKMDGGKDADGAEILLSDIITEMSIPLNTEDKYKRLMRKTFH
jgi:curli biogenesis system outer membrane secretion channel CsgG